jgi:steroid 5-alpha reductase family enzyme
VTERRIAVVGSGVSGMTAGYVLSHSDHVTMFEVDDRLGGHADTHPLLMTFLLTRGSGQRLTERRMAGRPQYADYVARTSGFIPWPPIR